MDCKLKIIMTKPKLIKEFKAKIGEMAVNIEGNLLLIVDSDLNKWYYDFNYYKIDIIVRGGLIKIKIYEVY